MEKITVIDFGGQYAHLIANRIRRLGVYSEISQPDIDTDSISRYKGIILSGGPGSVLEEDSPAIDKGILDLNIPVLGLCYGHQLIAKLLGGGVSRGRISEFGIAEITLRNKSALFTGLSEVEQVWMSHGDSVCALSEGFEILGTTSDCQYAAVGNENKRIYGLQFHPEVTHTPNGMKLLGNFLDICGCEREWNSKTFLKSIITDLKEKCGSKKVFLLVSGGVDSTVAFTLLNKVLGKDRVFGLHIDNGLMRFKESEKVMQYLGKQGFDNLHVVDASEEFLDALKGVSAPEKKREIIGRKFLEVNEEEQKKLGLNADEWLLAQGTIYPDTIESAGTRHADKIKTHHNRVDIILEMIEKGLIIEPLSLLYKDEVREIGEELGIPHDLVWRHPFPGPGLGVRILCSDGIAEPVTSDTIERVKTIADTSGYKSYILPVMSVGVQGDSRTYAHPVLLTGRQDWRLLEEISTRITNSVRMINRVVFGIDVPDNPEYFLKKAYLEKERLDKLRKVDNIVYSIIRESGEYEPVWQMPVVLLPLVDKNGNECVILRPVSSQEAMTARFYPLKDETFHEIVKRLRSLDGVGNVFLDITNKPPGTIEWE